MVTFNRINLNPYQYNFWNRLRLLALHLFGFLLQTSMSSSYIAITMMILSLFMTMVSGAIFLYSSFYLKTSKTKDFIMLHAGSSSTSFWACAFTIVSSDLHKNHQSLISLIIAMLSFLGGICSLLMGVFYSLTHHP